MRLLVVQLNFTTGSTLGMESAYSAYMQFPTCRSIAPKPAKNPFRRKCLQLQEKLAELSPAVQLCIVQNMARGQMTDRGDFVFGNGTRRIKIKHCRGKAEIECNV